MVSCTRFVLLALYLNAVAAFNPSVTQSTIRSELLRHKVNNVVSYDQSSTVYSKTSTLIRSSTFDLKSSTTDTEEKDEDIDNEVTPVDEVDVENEVTPADEVDVEETVEIMAESEDTKATSESNVQENISYVLALGAITGRGEFASTKQKISMNDVIKTIEKANPTPEPCQSKLVQGTWEVVYCSTQLFRNSPFFMAGRAVCQTDVERNQYDWFCDMHRKALAISTIGNVRQIISSTKLISEFEVKAGAIPFLSDFTPFKYSGGIPVTIDGAIVSSADINLISMDGASFELLMDTVEIKGSNIPGLRNLLDQGLKLESRGLGNLLEEQIKDYTNPKPMFRTTYLDDKMRISRDQDDNIFVYIKTSSSTTPTDYKSIDADLGVGKLLEGFNDAITRFYL